MNTHLQYAVGCGLQLVGLLNVVFLIGVSIWWGRPTALSERPGRRSAAAGP